MLSDVESNTESGTSQNLRVRLSDEEARLVDTVRAEVRRAPWIRHAVEQTLQRWRNLPPAVGLAPNRGRTDYTIGYRLPSRIVQQVDKVRGPHARDVWLREAIVRFAAGVQIGEWAP